MERTMENEEKKMKPIWYFVGLMLCAMGAVVFVSGVANYLSPGTTTTVLSNLHPELWWGAIMIAAGVIFLLANRKSTVG
jgi:predicted phage tail protein